MSTYQVTASATTPTQVEVAARQFRFLIDEPADLGGEDAAPNPVEYSLAALLGCFNVVVHLVARERGVTVTKCSLAAEGDLDPAKVLGQQTDARAGFQQIRLQVALETDADAATNQQIIDEAKGRCPVGDNLANATPLEITLA